VKVQGSRRQNNGQVGWTHTPYKVVTNYKRINRLKTNNLNQLKK